MCHSSCTVRDITLPGIARLVVTKIGSAMTPVLAWFFIVSWVQHSLQSSISDDFCSTQVEHLLLDVFFRRSLQ